jgi:hypothetical protein
MKHWLMMNMSKLQVNKILVIMLSVLIILFFVIHPVTNHISYIDVGSKLNTHVKSSQEISIIGRSPFTDKVDPHNYEYMYSLISRLFNGNQIDLLEIGIGCGPSYGDGHSLAFWDKIFNLKSLNAIELHCSCATEIKNNLVIIDKLDKTYHKIKKFNLICGDQASDETYNKILNSDIKLFDVIIDDGSHFDKHQLITLDKLINFVKPNGYLIIEDTSVCSEEPDRYGTKFCERVSDMVKLFLQSGTKSKYKELLRITNVIISFGVVAFEVT